MRVNAKITLLLVKSFCEKENFYAIVFLVGSVYLVKYKYNI